MHGAHKHMNRLNSDAFFGLSVYEQVILIVEIEFDPLGFAASETDDESFRNQYFDENGP